MSDQSETSFNPTETNSSTEFTDGIVGGIQRKRMWKLLQQILPAHSSLNILEINCGDGDDAITLASLGHRVTATDASEKMIAIAHSKRPHPARVYGTPEQQTEANRQVGSELFEKANESTDDLNVQFEVCSFYELGAKLNGRQFDAIFSNFGGLNCLNKTEIKHLNITLSGLLKTDGILIMVLMSKQCLWEKWYYFWRGDKYKSRRRRMIAAPVEFIDGQHPTWYYSIKELKKNFRNFKTVMSKPLAFFIPPSAMEQHIRKVPYSIPWLKFLDSIFADISFLADYGDHAFVVMKKR